MRKSCLSWLPSLGLLFLLSSLLAGCGGMPPVRPEPLHYKVAEGAEGRMFRTKDNLTLFGQWWEPTDPPKAVVLLVHGTGTHSGFYAPWANTLTARGFAVLGIDLRGWGQSQGYGRRGYVSSYDEYVDDLEQAFREVRYRYPALPVYLEGDSMGANVILLAHITGRIHAAGLILHAPAVLPNPGMGWLRVGSFSLTGVATLGRLDPDAPLLPIMSTFSHLAFFDDDARKRFDADPLCVHDALPAAYLIALTESAERLQQNLANVDAPLLVIQGSQDELVPVASSQLLMREAHSVDKTLDIFDGGSHETLNDNARQKVWADVLSWLDTRIHMASQDAAQATAASNTTVSAALAP